MRAIPSGFAAFASVAALLAGLAVAADVRAAPVPAEDLSTAATLPAEESVRAGEPAEESVRARAGDGAGKPAGEEPENFGASCRTVVQGSRVTAYCRNPYPVTDRVRLHVECERWWDLDTDSAPVDVVPTDYARVTARCWKEVAAAWLTHQPVDPPPARDSSGT
ncbi:hypothetical protein GCM10022244_19260 [Streptomyces gulbargensis]|uniref:Secreted protein n=1 Tax=Streptomyces gulbargensis TaxID=364901 RepID=A0ABP7LXM2_9ACTN